MRRDASACAYPLDRTVTDVRSLTQRITAIMCGAAGTCCSRRVSETRVIGRRTIGQNAGACEPVALRRIVCTHKSAARERPILRLVRWAPHGWPWLRGRVMRMRPRDGVRDVLQPRVGLPIPYADGVGVHGLSPGPTIPRPYQLAKEPATGRTGRLASCRSTTTRSPV